MGSRRGKRCFKNARFELITFLFLLFQNPILVVLLSITLACGDAVGFQDQGIIFRGGSVCSSVLCSEDRWGDHRGPGHLWYSMFVMWRKCLHVEIRIIFKDWTTSYHHE